MELKDLSKDQLLDLISQYDEFVQEANKVYTSNWLRITVEEFYVNLY